MADTPMVRGNALKKVSESEAAGHLERGWVHFDDADPATQGRWRALAKPPTDRHEHGALDPTVAALIDPKAVSARASARKKVPKPKS